MYSQSTEAPGAEPSTFLPTQAQWRRNGAYLFIGLLVVYVVLRGFVGAAARLFWFDEFLTLTIAGQRTPPEMWATLNRGFDIHPPLFYLVERLALLVPVKQEAALRLPSIVAFACTVVCIFAYAKRRSGELAGCVCAVLLLSTSLFDRYLVEARPYSPMAACIAFALVCYQRLPSIRWTVLLGLSLALAESFHYYAVFAMVPFGLAELVTFYSSRRFRWPVWLALVCGTLPLFACVPLLLRARTFYGGHPPFQKPVFLHLPDFYGSFFLVNAAYGAGLAVVALGAIALASRFIARSGAPSETGEGAGWGEATLLAAFVCLPVIVFGLVRVTDAALNERYVLACIFGILLGLACALSLVRPQVLALVALFVLGTIGWQEQNFWRAGRHAAGYPYSINSNRQLGQVKTLIESAGHPELPLVVGPAFAYVGLVHYLPDSWTGRAVALVDRQRDLQADGSVPMFMYKLLDVLKDYMPLRLQQYSDFTSSHNEFVLYAETDDDWVLTRLLSDNASLQLLARRGNKIVYLVQITRAAAAGGTQP
jgi:hypothetical protein